jgi:peptidoglycan/xylan/chitin deacetylase (PgdA/CDA1 family)
MASGEIINVSFHGVGVPPGSPREPGEHDYWVGRDPFLAILDELRGRNDVRLSFDDGNASDAEVALPALLERGMTADFFVVAGRLGVSGNLDAAGVRALLAAGMTVGTHGMKHRSWRRLGDEELRVELVEAREAIADAAGGATVDAAALPLGQYDRRVLAALRKAGYRIVYSSDARRARAGAWFQPRYSIRAGDTLDSIRESVLSPLPLRRRIRGDVAGMVKRLR